MDTSNTPGYRVDERGRLHATDHAGAVDASHQTPNVFVGLAPSLIVLHYTAAGPAESSVHWLCDRRANASAHLVVERDGRVWQLASFRQVTWHAGRSAWRGRTGCNSFAVGIEMANRGPAVGALAEAPGVRVHAAHRHGGPVQAWERYPEAQVATVVAICAALMARYPAITEVVGHDDVAPGRKLDPGPAWNWAGFRAALAAARLPHRSAPA